MKTLEDLRKILTPTKQQNHDNVCTINYDKMLCLLMLELIGRVDIMSANIATLNMETERFRFENRINLENISQNTLTRR